MDSVDVEVRVLLLAPISPRSGIVNNKHSGGGGLHKTRSFARGRREFRGVTLCRGYRVEWRLKFSSEFVELANSHE